MPRKSGATRVPNAKRRAESRARILRIAAQIFADRGFDGTRIEEIARRAKCNRALVYFYFPSKRHLFEAALKETVTLRRQQMGARPATLADIMIYWSEEHRRDPQPIRLLMQEGLAAAKDRAFSPPERGSYYDEQVAGVAMLQKAGLLRADITAREAFAIGLAVTSFPALLPQVTEALTGPDQPRGWEHVLRVLARLLGPPSKDR